MLGAASVTLAASQSTVVPVSLGALDGVLPGVHPLIAVATAQPNPAVQATATTLVGVAASVALEAEIAPATVLTQQGEVERLVFRVHNAGNTELELDATLSDLEGPIDADLIGLDGTPAAAIEAFRLPPFAQADLAIDASLLAAAEGEVTARVEVTGDPNVAAEATGSLTVVAVLCGGGGYDIDSNADFGPLTDSLLAMRRLFGFGGAALVTNALGSGALRIEAAAVAIYVDCIRDLLLDIDGDGQSLPLTDALLLLRYLFGFRGLALIDDAVGAGCTRCDAASIQEFIQSVLEG
jgi:hypothetical protein